MDFQSYWRHSDDEPLSKIDIAGFKAEVAASEGGYWAFINTPDGERIDAPSEIQDPKLLKGWVEESLNDLIWERVFESEAKKVQDTGKPE